MLDSIKAMPMKSRIAMAGSILGVLLVAVMLFKLATKPSYETVMSGVQPAETAKITTALDSAGIAYELQNNGTAVAVQSGQAAQARVALASQGLDAASSSSQPGFDALMSKQKLGTSSFQQQVTYQRALEGEIATTINGVAGTGGARVQLTLPQDTLFADDAKPATASVLLGGSGDAIEASQVKGIAGLVAGAVSGLKTSNVTITDGSGNILWPQQGDATSGGTSKAAAESRYAAQVQAQLMAMLDSTVGVGKAEVTVRPDIDVDKTTQDKLTYGKKGVALKVAKDTEKLTGASAGSAAGGTAGVTSNLANGSTTASAGSGSGSNYNKDGTTTDYGVDKVVEHRVLAAGTVNRMDVAVVIDKAAAANIPALTKALNSAAGIQTARGDTLTVAQVPFAKAAAATTPKASPIPAGAIGYAKYAGLGVGLLLFLFFVTRALKKRESSALAEPTWLTEISAPRTLGELEGGVGEPVALGPGSTQAAVEQFADQAPDKLAKQLREWMEEGVG
jgi:flagellar M-ring protein FliF